MATEFGTTRDGIGHSIPLPPPGEISEFDYVKTPVDYGRSFLITARNHRLEVATPAGQMSTDPQTGLPYAILPRDPEYMDVSRGPTSYHHHFYNRRHPDLEGDHRLTNRHFDDPELIPMDVIAGFAVRISRGQRLPVWLHRRTHDHYPTGPKLPHTIDEKFVTAAKACGGVVSRWALDLSSPYRNKLVHMDDDLFERVASPRLLCTERVYADKPADHRRKILGSFFLRYAATRDLSHISEKVVDEFLGTRDDARRLELGGLVLREAMEMSLAPVLPIYRDLKAQGMVHPGRPDIRTTVWKYVHPHRRDQVLPMLRAKLEAA